MFKTTPERRAIVRKSKAKTKRTPTEAQRRQTREKQNAYARANKNRRNEMRRARRNRHSQNEKIGAIELRERYAGMSVVTQARIANDATRWTGPGAEQERAIEKTADAWLRKNATEKQASSKDEQPTPPTKGKPSTEKIPPTEDRTAIEIVADFYRAKLRR